MGGSDDFTESFLSINTSISRSPANRDRFPKSQDTSIVSRENRFGVTKKRPKVTPRKKYSDTNNIQEETMTVMSQSQISEIKENKNGGTSNNLFEEAEQIWPQVVETFQPSEMANVMKKGNSMTFSDKYDPADFQDRNINFFEVPYDPVTKNRTDSDSTARKSSNYTDGGKNGKGGEEFAKFSRIFREELEKEGKDEWLKESSDVTGKNG